MRDILQLILPQILEAKNYSDSKIWISTRFEALDILFFS